MFSTSRGSYNQIHQGKLKQLASYVPKLVPYMLADSNVVPANKKHDPPFQSIKSKQKISSLMEGKTQLRKPKLNGIDQYLSSSENNENSNQRIAMKIRCSLQYFLTSIDPDEEMSPKLQYAIQNLLLNVLNIAKQLEQEGKKEKNFKKIKQKQSQQNQQQEFEEFKKYKESTHNNVMGNFIKIQQSQTSSIYQQQIQSKSISNYNPKSSWQNVKSNFLQHISTYNKPQSTPSYNEVIEKFIKMKENDLNRRSDISAQSSQPSNPEYRTIKETNSQMQQSLEQSQQIQSEIGVQKSALYTSILPQYCARNANYHSQYETKCHRNLAPQFQNAHNTSKQKTDEIDISISEYYIQDNSQKSSASGKENRPYINVKEFKMFDSAQIHPKHSQSKKQDKSYVYSQVLSRRKIF